jgi:hypothetical protein
LAKGKQTVMSGALPSVWQKEDGFDDNYVYQLKSTEGKSASIVKLSDLAMLTKRALVQNKEPIMVVTFEKAISPMPKDWVMIPMEIFKELLETKGG